MVLQDYAISIIDKVEAKLDPLMYQNGFSTKIRQSEESIFTEKLFYQKDPIEVAIVACMHPHDYPNSLSVRFVYKLYRDYRYISMTDLVMSYGKSFTDDPLLIASDEQIISTLSTLQEMLKRIFDEKMLDKWIEKQKLDH
jgi:hypothetical protein